ncbi:MAG: hypothetical protein AB1610_03870 [Nitrospirota bacterium]
MWRKLKDNFDNGIEKIKWFASLLSERLKIEYMIIKLFSHSKQLEGQRDELFKKIGQRLYELKEHPDSLPLKDNVIMEALNEIERLNNEIDLTKKKAAEISSAV